MKRPTVNRIASVLFRVALQSCASVACALSCIPGRTDTTGPVVNVEGVTLDYNQVVKLTAYGLLGLKFTSIPKATSQMPAQTPYIVYAGKDEHGNPNVWISSSAYQTKLDDTRELEKRDELTGAMVLAGIDADLSVTEPHLPPDPRLKALVDKAHGDIAAMAALQFAVQHAMRDMSVAIVQDSIVKQKWIFAHLPEGMPKAQSLALLKDHGLDVKPDKTFAFIYLPWRFEPGCYFSSVVKVTFDSSDRVYKVDLDDNHPDCL